MKVTCSSCNRGLNVPENLIGKTVACPACKAPVKVEEQLTFAAQTEKSADSQRALGMNRQQAGIGQPGTCQGCGFPIPANKAVCNRCGMNRETGARDEGGVGYKASGWQKSAGARNKVISAVVAVVILALVVFAVRGFLGWASRVTEEKKKEAEEKAQKKRRRRPSRSKKTASTKKDDDAKDDGAKAAAAKPVKRAPKKPAPKPKRSAAKAKPKADITDMFEEAYVLLTDPIPATSRRGAGRIRQLGPTTIPLLAAKIAEEEDVATRALCIKTLSRFRTRESAEALVALIGDKSHRVRGAAVTGLVTQGRGVSELVGEAVGAEDARTRVAAIRIVNKVKLADHTDKIVQRLKSDEEPEVRQEAARALGGSLANEAIYEHLIAALSDESADVAYEASEALAGQARSVNKVVDALKNDPGGEDDDRYTKLFLLGWPILASGDTAAGELLAKRVCSEKPIPEVVKYITSMLASGNSVISRDAVRQAIGQKDYAPPTSIAALLCLASPDRRVRGAAEDYATNMPSISFPVPLIACMGSQDVKFAVSCARILSGAKGEQLTSALRRAAKGVQLQRKTLAAVALALQGDETGFGILEAVATGDVPMASPIPGLAAYGYANIKKGERKDEFYQASRSTTERADKLYYAAAAARSGHEESLTNLRAMLRDRKMGALRFEAARMLSEMNDTSSQDALLVMLKDADDSAQLAAARALARLGNDEIIPELFKRMPRLYDVAQAEVRMMIAKFGDKAVPHVAKALSDTDPRIQTAALEVIHELGRKTPAKLVKTLGVLLQNTRLPARTQEAIKKAVIAATGARPRPEWTWRDWVKACGMSPGDIVKQLELTDVTWNWVTMRVPETWDRNNVSCTGMGMRGTPSIAITQEFDSIVSGFQKGFWSPQHDSLATYRKNRINALAMTNMGQGKWAPRASARVENASPPNLRGYKTTAFRITDKDTGRITYYVLCWLKLTKTYWYMEVAFSAEIADYRDYKKLFESKLARTISISPKQIELKRKK